MTRLDTCMLCPRLCRPACPVATGTWREAAVPSAIATAIVQSREGRWDVALAREAATLCTGCGACTDHCHVHHPLADLLASARAGLFEEPEIDALEAIQGEGRHLVIEADDRPLAKALAKHLEGGVRVLRTRDFLGVKLVEFPGFAEHAARLRTLIAEEQPMVGDGAVARVLDAAGISYQWVTDVVPCGEVLSSCACAGSERALACCGGAGPLAEHHPQAARDVAQRFLRDEGPLVLADARCRRHLRQVRPEMRDAIDLLLESAIS